MEAVDVLISLIKGSAALGILAFAFRKLVPHFDPGNRRASWPRAFAVAGTLVGAGFAASLFDTGLVVKAIVELVAGGVAGKIAFRISIPLSIAIAFIGELIVGSIVLGVTLFVAPLVMLSPVLAAVVVVFTVGVLAVTRWRRGANPLGG